jgi:hypothetical protein
MKRIAFHIVKALDGFDACYSQGHMLEKFLPGPIEE